MHVTEDILIAAFAPRGSSDGIRIFSDKGRSVGYITDLRKLYRDGQAKAEKAKVAKAAAHVHMSRTVNKAIADLKTVFEGTPAKVFINKTMPNVKFRGATFYFMVTPGTERTRLSIIYPNILSCGMVYPKGVSFVLNGNTNQVLVDGMDIDECIKFTRSFCEHIVEIEIGGNVGKK
ncbi:Alc [Aeromonas phage Asfd_1]|nr:Alc [Aeromonas phage Asfd_1]